MTDAEIRAEIKVSSAPWFLYIIEADDGSLYTGITTNVDRRFAEHQSSPKGARYFRGRKPVAVRYIEACANRAIASKREYQVKALSAAEKRQLIEQGDTELFLRT